MKIKITNRQQRIWVMALCALLAGGAATAQTPSAEDHAVLPAADHSELEPAVGAQLDLLRQYVRTRIAAGGSALEQAEAVGELGRHYGAYELNGLAEACYREAARLNPRDFRWRYHLAHLLQSTGRLEEAAAGYERALGIVPEVPPALIRLGQVYAGLNRPEAAEDVLRRALELDPSSSAAQSVLGEVYLSQQRFEQAVTLLTSALDKVPDANRLYYPLALAHRGLGNDQLARDYMARRGTVGIRPADPLIDGLKQLTTGERVHLLRGQAAFGAGRFGEAADEFSQAVEVRPDSVSARVNLGSALAAAGETDEAIESFRAAIQLAPGNATARFNLGSILRQRGDFNGAALELGQAVQYAPRDAAIHAELAVALRSSGDSEQALIHYAITRDLDPTKENVVVGEAALLAELGRFAQAKERLLEAHELLPGSGAVAYSLARILASCPDIGLRDGEQALDLAERVHRAQPTAGHAQVVAEALAQLGRCEEAGAWQRQALANLGDDERSVATDRLENVLARYLRGAPCASPGTTAPSPG